MYTVEMRIRGTGAGVFRLFLHPCALRQRSAALQEAMPDTARTIRPCANFCVWETPGRMSRMNGLMFRCRTAALKSYGRISRSNCTWDEEFQVFTLTSDVEESSTRSEDISLDYDFFHSDLLELSCGGNYTARIIPKDINIWISRLFLGDADGFSILYYQDVDSLVYWANQAAYRWKLRGMCMWSLGQEDMRLWEWLPKQI